MGELGGEIWELEGIKAVEMGETSKGFNRASEEEKNAQEERAVAGESLGEGRVPKGRGTEVLKRREQSLMSKVAESE